jgi:tetratricopeptide (TPR) repeat protein
MSGSLIGDVINPWPKRIVGAVVAIALVAGVFAIVTNEDEPPPPPPAPAPEQPKPPPPKPEPTIVRREPKPRPEPTTKAQLDAAAIAVKAAAAQAAGRLPEAEKLYRKALSKDPTNLVSLVAMADLCQAKNNRECTLEHLRRANKAYVDDAALHMRLGDLLLEADKLVEARVHFEEAQALGDPQAAARLAAIATQEKR